MKKILSLLGIGILIGLLIAHIRFQGFFIPWTRLADIPEKPQKILAVNKGVWIKTESANIYHYLSSAGFPFAPVECSRNCWQKFEAAPTNDTYIIKSSGCGRYTPSTRRFMDSFSGCQGFGVGAFAFSYGFDKNGKVYYWVHEIGDMDGLVYYLFPMLGGIAGVVISLVWLFISEIYAIKIKSRKISINYDDLPDN